MQNLTWNHEANPSVFTARNDIYALEFFNVSSMRHRVISQVLYPVKPVS